MSHLEILLFYSRFSHLQKSERPFSVRYDPYTQSVEVIDNKFQLKKVIENLKSEMNLVSDTIEKLAQ